MGSGSAASVAREEVREESVGPVAVGDAGQAELADEPILEVAEEGFDAALGLRGGGGDPADADLLEGAPHLRRRRSTLELLLEGERPTGGAGEDPCRSL